ncbi:MAG: tungstate ABC transporter substrate-binding protein WtpA [Bacteroidales bacterium]
MKKHIILFLAGISVLFMANCTPEKQQSNSEISGELVIFHAGSLSGPLHEIADSFNVHYPDVNIKLEASGSVDAARKITDLDREADIMASADYKVIEELLIPEFTSWLIKFASNELALVFNEKSRYASKINQDNWPEILLRKDVSYGRSDPNSDPCGYRSVIAIKLAKKYYKKNQFAEKLLNKNKNFIRPKETDLLALLETNALDYIFLYRSVAEQHELKYLSLPDSINLGSPQLKKYYSTISTEISGKTPNEKITIKGEPMVYGITQLNDAPNPSVAKVFMHFVLSQDKGLKIMENNGQSSVVPAKQTKYESIPKDFKQYVRPEN